MGTGWLWLVALLSAGLWWAINREAGNKKRAMLGKDVSVNFSSGGEGGAWATIKRLANFAFWMITVVALLYAPLLWFDTSLGILGADLGREIHSWFNSTVPAGAIAEVILIILLAAMVFDLIGKRVDVVARAVVIVAPSLAQISTGTVGTAAAAVLAAITGGSVDFVQDLANQANP